eukprot:4330500-Pyramimonas_sp.AAC.1
MAIDIHPLVVDDLDAPERSVSPCHEPASAEVLLAYTSGQRGPGDHAASSAAHHGQHPGVSRHGPIHGRLDLGRHSAVAMISEQFCISK